MADREVCIGGNKYRILDDDSTPQAPGGFTTPQTTVDVDMTATEQSLKRLVDINGGGDIGGGYRSIAVTVPKHEKAFDIVLGLHATQVNIRSDQGLTITLNSVNADNIFISASEFPFVISDLKLNESIHTIYVTTGDNDTNVKVLAFGLVG